MIEYICKKILMKNKVCLYTILRLKILKSLLPVMRIIKILTLDSRALEKRKNFLERSDQ